MEQNSFEVSKKKQIEGMAKVLCECCTINVSPCILAKTGKMCGAILEDAEALYSAGYRKMPNGGTDERAD